MITLDGLTKVFPAPGGGADVVALDDIDLTVDAGQIHGIVGRSGAGKSTLIRCLTGLEKPTSGHVSIDGTDIAALDGASLRAARRNIGMVFQHANLLDSRTAAQNIAHPLEIAGVPRARREQRVAELVELVGLSGREHNHPAQLSGGQVQRVGIARGLAAEPKVLLCDEPTSALDPSTTRQILTLIRDLRDRLGITVVIITHEMSVVREVCDAVTLLEGGRVVQSGGLLDVASDPHGPLSSELIPLPPAPTGISALVVNCDYGDSETLRTSDDLVRLAGERGAHATIVAGTIETIGGRQVGRVQLALRNDSGAPISREGLDAFIHALDAQGVVAQEVTR
ncbi:methionine ABC transporter ATP-binding protein [Brachybacterium huguangmaarense]|uniref:Methionine ABC transporter ATP-binding protein n=1 Tax=Brachybacterium huguangmaarense TaxID=1652028 RepID=A0ABY6G2E4_9MICO|nr:methionine ABC transporter ATP-binding protein [Brachybacterium huguangmaarense]UYG17377.1 methionine ABC transporter ATP-binding protein [Brachybacterium huguangmaarense]